MRFPIFAGFFLSLFVFILHVPTAHTLPVVPIVAGVAATTGLYFYTNPTAYYKGNLDVCITAKGDFGANPWFGHSTCVYPGVRVTLNKKERIKFDAMEIRTKDNKKAMLSLDCIVLSENLEDVQLSLVNQYYIAEIPFKDAVLETPIKYCVATYSQNLTYEQLFEITNPGATYGKVVKDCLRAKGTNYEPTMHMYATLKRLS